ncbi:MAG TPA: YceI family protein [Pyrinomonadaceae bacterium]|jgi:polyisoprenoid-binding protein YceI
MRLCKLSTFALAALLALSGGAADSAAGVGRAAGEAGRQAPAVYRLDASRSELMIRAFAGGPLWFKGHDHLIRARDFEGEASLTPGSAGAASLTLTVRAASLAETRDEFTPEQKKIIDGELLGAVLEPDKYPEITFRSTDASVEPRGGDLYALRLGGDLTLRGVTRHVTVPVEVTLRGDEMRARGEFTVKRSDFKVPATSAFHGTVRVRDRLKVSFEIVARRVRESVRNPSGDFRGGL